LNCLPKLLAALIWGSRFKYTLFSPACQHIFAPILKGGISRVLFWAIINLGPELLRGSSGLPGSRSRRATSPPLFGLAPGGVCPAPDVTIRAVSSYLAFSPLPQSEAVFFLWHFPSPTTLAVGAWVLPSTLPSGARTFLPSHHWGEAIAAPLQNLTSGTPFFSGGAWK